MVLKHIPLQPNIDQEFENDVKMYGTQTDEFIDNSQSPFENDVKMYGTQTLLKLLTLSLRLRMM